MSPMSSHFIVSLTLKPHQFFIDVGYSYTLTLELTDSHQFMQRYWDGKYLGVLTLIILCLPREERY